MNDADLAALALRVAALERKLEVILSTLNLSFTEESLTQAETEAAKWLKLGDINKVQAIKAYREVTGVGLQEAMKAVEALQVKLAMRK
jgi:ribosomal protein L7/L12